MPDLDIDIVYKGQHSLNSSRMNLFFKIFHMWSKRKGMLNAVAKCHFI